VDLGVLAQGLVVGAGVQGGGGGGQVSLVQLVLGGVHHRLRLVVLLDVALDILLQLLVFVVVR